jgi:hypothetical protein
VYIIGKLSSERRTFHGFQLLVRHITPLEAKLTALDIAELGVYFREVCTYFFVQKY